MATYRSRGISPPPRRHGEPRISTGPVFSTAFDTRYAQQPRSSIDSIDALPLPRTGIERRFDAQPISRRNYAASGQHAAQSKTEYAVRPRREFDAGDDGSKTQLRILPTPTSPIRSRPLVDNFPREMPRSPLTKQYYPSDEADRYILPAVSGPRQHRSQGSTNPTDSTHLVPAGRDRREHGGYRVAGARVYPTNRALVRYDEEDDYSYTTPREQFERDYPPPQPRSRRSSYTRNSRPISTSEFDDWKATPLSKRDPGPPPTVRQFDKIGEGGSRRSLGNSSNYSDTEGDLNKPKRRHSSRVPVSLHQDRLDRFSSSRVGGPAREWPHVQSKTHDDEPSYSSDRENYRPSSHYERHPQRPTARGESHDYPGSVHGVAVGGLGGLAAAGLSSAIAKKARDKDDDSDRDGPGKIKDKYTQDRDYKFGDAPRDRERIVEKTRDRAAELRDEVAPRDQRRENGRTERSDSDSIEDGQTDSHRRRRRHRSHRRDSAPQELDSDSATDDRKAVELPVGVDGDRAETEAAPEGTGLARRDRRHSHAHQRVLADDERYAGTPADDQEDDVDDDEDEDRAARLELVEPPKEKEMGPRPKGILKPARQIPFPEDPNPTREGVAPLKDAGKKGVPPGARWTKINRMLVNPAALEADQERYEERDDYVIVLRVLSREDIQKLADKTKEIRGKDEKQPPHARLANCCDRSSRARMARAAREKKAERWC
jgi:hypothetical protein